jgi:hypothetical protein
MRLVFTTRQRWFHGLLIWLCSLLMLVSLVASYPQAKALMAGQRLELTQATAGLRLLREATLAVVVLLIALRMLTSRGRAPVLSAVTWTVVIAGYAVFVFARALMLGLDVRVPLSGLRVFQYAPLALAAYLVALHWRARMFRALAVTLRILLMVWLPLALYQVLNAPPFQGRTIFGSRAFGTFNEANVFGVTIATMTLWLVLTQMVEDRRGWRPHDLLWLGICIVLATLSGSRTAVAMTILAVAFPIVALFRRHVDQLTVAAVLPLVVFGTLIAGSTAAISGRRTNLFADARLERWQEVLGAVQSPSDLLFGWGLGLGSNTLSNVFGYYYFEGQFIADSHYVFVLGSFGLVGLVLFLLALVPVAVKGPQPASLMFVGFVLLLSAPLLPFELFPVAPLVFLMWGGLLGIAQHDRRLRMEASSG